MPGIYLHIPFCRQACHYCDFHFSTNLTTKTAMVQAIVQELQVRKNYFSETPFEKEKNQADQTIHTVYFGGGTPSLLETSELAQIMEAIRKHFSVAQDAEITIECNPEDLHQSKLQALKSLGINRLSMGIQTFHDPVLKFMNRVHDASQAQLAVRLAQEIGFENMTIDLMYALPGSSEEILKKDLEIALGLNVPHISAYCFTLEEKTVFGKQAKKGLFKPNENEFEQQQYVQLVNALSNAGYEQYEISNFAQNFKYSRHNSAYWFGVHYLGIGPGAHSFNGTERQWNISNNPIYIQQVQKGSLPYETEILTRENRINELLMTGLRTKWGVNLNLLKEKHQFDLLKISNSILNTLQHQELVTLDQHCLKLTESGKLLADKIIMELMV